MPLEVQLRSAAKVPHSLTDREFFISFYESYTREYKREYASIQTDATGQYMYFEFAGETSVELFEHSPMSVTVCEDGDRGVEEIFTAILTIRGGPPFEVNNNEAALSTSALRIWHDSDAEDEVTVPVLSAKLVPFGPKKAPPVITPAPSFTTVPAITGSVVVGQTLTGSNGTIINGSVSARQWLRNGVAISGATVSTYTLVSADAGASITYRVTATGAGGSTSSTSSPVAVPAAPVTPTLFALSLSSTSATVGAAFSANIIGSTTGSTLTATGLPAGLVINSAARTITGTPTAGGSASVTIVETLAGATGSPRSTVVTITVAAVSKPIATGDLPHRYFAINTGPQSFNIASGFTGSGITYSVTSAPAGASYTINATTGEMVVQTTGTTSGDVTVRATNGAGFATQTFPLFVVAAAQYTVLARQSNGTVTVESLAAPRDLSLTRNSDGSITIREITS